MNIALFGGTFDPIHTGHLRAARTAARKFRLGRILFVPSGNPPHKSGDRLTPFHHRFAMVALACASDPRFVASLLEAPSRNGRPRYSINTAVEARKSLRSTDRLFFLLGVDAFLDLPHWHQYRRLFDLVNFIVVSRPGFHSEGIWRTVPNEMIRPSKGAVRRNALHLRKTAVHILRGVDVPLASRDIREAIRAGRRVAGLVPPLVEQYILKEGLYQPDSTGQVRR